MRSARAKALILLEQYASVNSQEAPVQSMLSTYYAEDKLRQKALASANAALALTPKDPDVLADIAETYDDLGDRKRAIQFARDSLKNGYTLTDLQERPALQGLLAAQSSRPRGRHGVVKGGSPWLQQKKQEQNRMPSPDRHGFPSAYKHLTQPQRLS